MPQDIISGRTRLEFREYFVEMGTLRTIEAAFSVAGLTPSPEEIPDIGGQRRTLVEQYYRRIHWAAWPDVRKALEVFEHVLVELSLQAEGEGTGADSAQEWLRRLLRWLRRDGFQFEDSRLRPPPRVAELDAVSLVAVRLDASELQRQVQRMHEAVDQDPGLAVGTAKELLETTCKTILSERGIEPDNGWDVVRLVKRTRQELRLLPEDVPDEAKGVGTIRRLLSNLGTVAQGMAELRNLYGTGHGRAAGTSGVQPRHARLAVGAAATLAAFLFETHLAQADQSPASGES